MTRFAARSFVAPAALLLAGLAYGCASAPRTSGTYSGLIITGEQVREDGYATAYEALTHHRDIIIFEGQVAFEGGNDSSGTGRAKTTYTVPLLVVNGDYNLNDAVTTLRRIRAADIISIRLYYRSMVPPVLRRPGAEGGVIAVETR